MDFQIEFLKKLEDIYLGRIKNLEGNSGYINLIYIKSQYYQDIIKTIKETEQLLSYSLATTNKEQQEYIKHIYEKIYTFFHKYLNDTGTPFYSNVKVYNTNYVQLKDNKDVALFWKTQDLYYIKTEKVFESMTFDMNNVKYVFDTSLIERQIANEKITYYYIIQNKNIKKLNEQQGILCEVCINVVSNKDIIDGYNILNKKDCDNFLKEIKKIYSLYNKDDLYDAIKKFNKQSDIDYFIHKNAKEFLNEQLDIYLFEEIGKDVVTKFTEETINRYHDVRKLAIEIIELIARFENELKSIWEKPKMVKNSNYIITIDMLSVDIIDILISEQPRKQYDEWLNYEFIPESWQWINLKDEQYKYLPLDTKNISGSLKYKILACFDDIDKHIDGILVKSDNFQALNTIKSKYNEKINLIYIDPPFNTGSDFGYIDNFQDSTWSTIIDNRLMICKNMLSNYGSFYLHLDYRANYLGRLILNNVFGSDLLINHIVWQYFMGGKGKKEYAKKHDDILLYSKTGNYIFNSIKIKRYLNFIPALEDQSKEAQNGKDNIGYYSIVACPDVWDISSVFNMSAEYIKLASEYKLTQKPERLLERIIGVSSNSDSIVLDCFLGTGTTINVAHKMGRKWIGVEMGEHFYSVIIPRIKQTLYGKISGVSESLKKENNLKIGGFVKYYELETYEDVLASARYVEHNNLNDILIWDEKLSYVITYKDDKILIDFAKLGDRYTNFQDEHYKYSDIAETLSNLFGYDIIKINKNMLLLDTIGEIDMDNIIIDATYLNTFKKLIWWDTY